MPLKVLDSDGNVQNLHAQEGDGSQGSPFVLSHWMRNLGALLADLAADGVATAVARTQVVAALQMFNGATFDRVRGDVANGIDVDVTRLPPLPAGANIIGAVSAAFATLSSWINRASNADAVDTIAAAVLSGMNELWMHLRLPSGVSGTLTFEGSLDGANWFPLPPDSSVVRGLVTSTIVLATNVVTLTNPVAAVSLVVPYDSPPPYVRVTYDNTAGGSGTVGTYAAAYFARAT